MPTFVPLLKKEPGVAARALEFTVLTAARTNETIGAKWSEIDLDAKVWTVPASKMKMEREHRVALSAAALVVLNEMKLAKSSDFVFPEWSSKKKVGLSDAAMASVLKRMRAAGVVLNDRDGRPAVVHGFRSTFSTWVASMTNYPEDVRELALAHGDDSKVSAAYQRDDLLEKRYGLMEDWAAYCVAPSAAARPVLRAAA